MLDYYRAILQDVRSPERTEAMLRLVDILIDTNYADDLTGIDDYVAMSDDQITVALNIESFICNCTYTLLNKMGIVISLENINAKPNAVADIIDTILQDVDSFDDYDTMLQIVQHEANPVEAIGCLVAFVRASDDHRYIELMESVYDGTIKKLVDILTARALVDLDASKEIDHGIVAQLVLFKQTYPESPVLPLLADYGYMLPDTDILDDVTVSQSENIIYAYATSVAGVLFTKFTDFESAYERIEYLCEYMIGDRTDINVSQVMLNVSDILDKLYKEKGADV